MLIKNISALTLKALRDAHGYGSFEKPEAWAGHLDASALGYCLLHAHHYCRRATEAFWRRIEVRAFVARPCIDEELTSLPAVSRLGSQMAALRNVAVPVSMGSPEFDGMSCGPFLVTNARFPASHTLGKHFHDRAVVGLTLAGEWSSVVGSTRLANSPGMLHIEPAGDSHVNQFGSQGAHVVIVQPDQRDTLLQPFKSVLANAFQISVGFPGLQIAERLQCELCDRDDLTPLAVENLCVDLLVSTSRLQRTRNEPAPAWLLRAVDCARARFLERPSLRELGDVAGVSPGHFSREFRRLYGMSAAQYLRRLRLEWAAERLRKPDDPLAEIASAAGFADQSHFTRRFKRQFGVTPAAFRAASRAGI